MELTSPLDAIKGIGEKTKQLFSKAGIDTVFDLLCDYPRSYEHFEPPRGLASLKEGDLAAVKLRLAFPPETRYVRGLTITTALAGDGNNALSLTWYRMPYLKNSLLAGKEYVFRGQVRVRGQCLVMEQPAVYSLEQYQGMEGKLLPVYSLAKGMTNRMVTKAVQQALSCAELLTDSLPEEIRARYRLMEYGCAIRQIHFPENAGMLRLARTRLVFDEFFYFLLQLSGLKKAREAVRNPRPFHPVPETTQLIAGLPYTLTGAQSRVWQTIEAELQGERVMARLIQGDVGSGKTVVSFLAMTMAAANGFQSALMAPTEVLARQHYDAFGKLMEAAGLPFRAVLLTGSMTVKEKREAYREIASGNAAAIIGTHALIQEKVEYRNLALVITDEQHRFGVRQRQMLAEKGQMPHTIVMSATPIPRTLAVILYGDLDISVIDELPADRLPVKNCVVGTGYRKKAYAFIQKEVEQGHQAYVICPMVEESETVEGENVVEYAGKLRESLPASCTVEYLHGQMKPKEKTAIMERFLAGEIQVLVSTTVIEVGVNVPNATVMMIENSERFGLAQLHQLRGRVGRGSAQSYCIFLHTQEGRQVQERLDVLCKSNDGFEIASRDMQLRGPGDLFGVRQSGMLDFALADIYADAAVLAQANEAVKQLQREDPELVFPEHAELKRRYDLLSRRQDGNPGL